MLCTVELDCNGPAMKKLGHKPPKSSLSMLLYTKGHIYDLVCVALAPRDVKSDF